MNDWNVAWADGTKIYAVVGIISRKTNNSLKGFHRIMNKISFLLHIFFGFFFFNFLLLIILDHKLCQGEADDDVQFS